MQLFYTPSITLPRYTLPAEESAHAARVLRLAAGDTLHLTDGRGNLFTARMVRPDAKGCEVEVFETAAEYGKLPYNLMIGIAPTKNIDRLEWFLEKATEIGVDRFVPLECARSERRVIKPERLEKVVTGAVKQSLKAYHPALDELTPFAEFIKEPFEGVRLIAHCDDVAGERAWIGDCLRPGVPVRILIGPEGDFSPAEIGLAMANGYRGITLGGQRLRTETAGLAAVMAVHFFTYE